VRLAGSQVVTAIAEMSDGSQWMDTAHVQVTLSACVDESG
jgi:sulfur-oxidizing protein SoxY